MVKELVTVTWAWEGSVLPTPELHPCPAPTCFQGRGLAGFALWAPGESGLQASSRGGSGQAPPLGPLQAGRWRGRTGEPREGVGLSGQEEAAPMWGQGDREGWGGSAGPPPTPQVAEGETTALRGRSVSRCGCQGRGCPGEQAASRHPWSLGFGSADSASFHREIGSNLPPEHGPHGCPRGEGPRGCLWPPPSPGKNAPTPMPSEAAAVPTSRATDNIVSCKLPGRDLCSFGPTAWLLSQVSGDIHRTPHSGRSALPAALPAGSNESVWVRPSTCTRGGALSHGLWRARRWLAASRLSTCSVTTDLEPFCSTGSRSVLSGRQRRISL